eukprot:TRINITY_DN55527_c0_g1_i1.p1 TRINITY_DN55527_c0_g1~~TRINITY_DN55527_c0_g1_i1.p1  ORF type:complete len:722 (+),score=112.31 TRINITY_DN55527_c0_g1_i1:109-2274(+)
MEGKKRRPPSLSETALGRTASTKSDGVPRVVGSLRSELDVILRRHNEEIHVCVERWSALQETGWRSAPSIALLPHEGNQSVSLPGANFAAPAFPASNFAGRKLPPPRAPLTPVNSSGANAPKNPFQPLEVVVSPRSLLSTRSGSCSLSQDIPFAGEDEMSEDPSCLVLGQPPAFLNQLNSGSPVKGTRVAWSAGEASYDDTNGDSTIVGRPVSNSETEKMATQDSPVGDVRIFPSPRRLQTRWSADSKKGTSPSSTTLFFSQSSSSSAKQTSRLYSTDYGMPALRSITRSSKYEFINAVLIVLNASFVVWETQRRSSLATAILEPGSEHFHQSEEMFFGILSNCFCVVFVVDLILRMMAERWRFWFHSNDRGWNMFDTIVVASSVLEVAVQWLAVSSEDPSNLRRTLRKFSVLRILRFLRVVRITRALRIIRVIRELRLMVFSLTASLRSLLWAVVMIFFIVLVFGIVLTDGVVTYCITNNAAHLESTVAMRKYFGGVGRSVISLFMAMTGGEDWGPIFESLAPLPQEYNVLFLGFICFAILALLNVVTAVFINTALQRSQSDRELAVQQEMETKNELALLIKQLFIELDTNRTGGLTLEEFEARIEEEKVLAYLKSLGIDIGQVRTLFTLLDVDQTGDVDMDEFVEGVQRLRGNATSMDLAILTYQVEWMLHSISNIIGTDGRNGSFPRSIDQDGRGDVLSGNCAPRLSRFGFSAVDEGA